VKIAGYLFAAALVAAASTALADRRVFIVANQPDAYGIDQCLAGGESCGASVARAWCRSQDFRTASAWRRLEPDEVTGAIPASTGTACAGRSCAAAYIAITCER
jgi:hypothetical protein